MPALVDWPGGLPPLDRVRAADFGPAFAWAMQRKRDELAEIATQPAPATFDNTIAALERSGLALSDLRALFDLWGRAFRDDAYDAVEEALGPKLAAFAAEIVQDPKLARRVETVWRARGNTTTEQRRLTELVYDRFAAARLPASARARVIELDARIEELYARFNQQLAAGSAATAVVLRDQADLVGLPAPLRADLAAAATARSLTGAWVITNQYNAIQAFLAASPRRDLRERVWQASKHRADRPPHDNTAIVKEVLRLRGERARLVGKASYAGWKTERSMLAAPQARDWLMTLAGPASEQARAEIAILQHAADKLQDAAHAPRFALQPWDLRYYEERVRISQYELDEAEIAAYLELDRVRDAAFWVAGQLFELTLTALPDAPVPSKDVTMWSVDDKAGKRIGVLVFDPHPRPGKDGGAWALGLRDQQRVVPGRVPVASVHYNLPHGHLTWFEAVGLFPHIRASRASTFPATRSRWRVSGSSATSRRPR
ncbi:MAG: M3 family metallopeptidase [Kofleriaceae bacterium]